VSSLLQIRTTVVNRKLRRVICGMVFSGKRKATVQPVKKKGGNKTKRRCDVTEIRKNGRIVSRMDKASKEQNSPTREEKQGL